MPLVILPMSRPCFQPLNEVKTCTPESLVSLYFIIFDSEIAVAPLDRHNLSECGSVSVIYAELSEDPLLLKDTTVPCRTATAPAQSLVLL